MYVSRPLHVSVHATSNVITSTTVTTSQNGNGLLTMEEFTHSVGKQKVEEQLELRNESVWKRLQLYLHQHGKQTMFPLNIREQMKTSFVVFLTFSFHFFFSVSVVHSYLCRSLLSYFNFCCLKSLSHHCSFVCTCTLPSTPSPTDESQVTSVTPL